MAEACMLQLTGPIALIWSSQHSIYFSMAAALWDTSHTVSNCNYGGSQLNFNEGDGCWQCISQPIKERVKLYKLCHLLYVFGRYRKVTPAYKHVWQCIGIWEPIHLHVSYQNALAQEVGGGYLHIWARSRRGLHPHDAYGLPSFRRIDAVRPFRTSWLGWKW